MDLNSHTSILHVSTGTAQPAWWPAPPAAPLLSSARPIGSLPLPPPPLQLGDAVTAILPSAFMENLLPGGGQDPIKLPDGTIAISLPI